jgi:hypothetical protein
MINSSGIWQGTVMPFQGRVSKGHGPRHIDLTLISSPYFNASMPRQRSTGPAMPYAKSSSISTSIFSFGASAM